MSLAEFGWHTAVLNAVHREREIDGGPDGKRDYETERVKLKEELRGEMREKL